MKKVILSAALLFALTTMEAQVKTPQASPLSKVEQTVGLTNVEIEYSRPGSKGRTVFGELVPYGKLWRTGANANTTVAFSEDVTIDGKLLKKGKYALYTLPKADSWEVIFYNDTDNWGLPEKWDERQVRADHPACAARLVVVGGSYGRGPGRSRSGRGRE